jgi:hypothetical protein
MKTLCALVLVSILVSPALSQTTPGGGTFGLSISFSGQVGNNAATISNGLGGVYWVDNHWVISGGLALSSIADVATIFTFSAGGRYHFNKNTISPLVAAAMFLNIISPSGAGAKSTTQFGFLLGGGAEYFLSRSFGMIIFQGLQFSTEPTTFAFVSRLGLEWYF